MINYIPHILLYTRLVLGPVLLSCAELKLGGVVLFSLLFLAVLTDIFDGVLARKLGVATEWLRRADSAIDTVFFAFVLAVLYRNFSETWNDFALGIYFIFVIKLIRAVYDHIKFKKQAAYHMYSAKFWGLTLLLAFSEVFLTGHGGMFFSLAIIVGVITNFESLVASFILKESAYDIPSLYHVISKKNN